MNGDFARRRAIGMLRVDSVESADTEALKTEMPFDLELTTEAGPGTTISGSIGPGQVQALVMPENDSDPQSETLAREVAERYGVNVVVENIAPALDGFGCYRRRDEAIRRISPSTTPPWDTRRKSPCRRIFLTPTVSPCFR